MRDPGELNLGFLEEGICTVSGYKSIRETTLLHIATEIKDLSFPLPKLSQRSVCMYICAHSDIWGVIRKE